MKTINILIASALLLIATAAQAAEVVGKVGYMSGSLVAKRADGTIKIMGSKADVLAGDVLGTAKDSYAQILMNDGMKMTLRPNSNLKIVNFHFNRQEPQSDTAVFSLIKGGLRSVSGLVGKRGNPDAYQMQTKVATVGIRGTDFSARLCETENCQDDAEVSAKLSAKPQATPLQAAWHVAQSLSVWKILALPLKAMMTAAFADTAPSAASPAGLYVTVHTGQVLVAQPTGNTLNLGRGETGFADRIRLDKIPTPKFMAADTKQTDAVAAKAAKAEEKAGNKPDDGATKGKQDKEKDSGKSEKDKDGGKSDKEADSGKSDEGKTDSKSDEGKAAGNSDGDKTDSTSGEGQTDSPPAEGGTDSISPDAGNAASTDPSVNKSGCVVQ